MISKVPFQVLHNHSVKMSTFMEAYPHDQITKHGFLAVHFIAVLIGFHGNLENVYRLYCDQAASSYSQNTHQVLGAIKEIVSSLGRPERVLYLPGWGWRAFFPATGFELL